MLIGFRDLTQHRIRLHVLDICLDERGPLFDSLDDYLLADDGFVDERVLRGGGFPRSREIVIFLLLSMQERCSSLGGEGSCNEEGQRYTGDRLFPENHDVRLLRLPEGKPEYGLDASTCCDNRLKILLLPCKLKCDIHDAFPIDRITRIVGGRFKSSGLNGMDGRIAETVAEIADNAQYLDGPGGRDPDPDRDVAFNTKLLGLRGVLWLGFEENLGPALRGRHRGCLPASA